MGTKAWWGRCVFGNKKGITQLCETGWFRKRCHREPCGLWMLVFLACTGQPKLLASVEYLSNEPLLTMGSSRQQTDCCPGKGGCCTIYTEKRARFAFIESERQLFPSESRWPSDFIEIPLHDCRETDSSSEKCYEETRGNLSSYQNTPTVFCALNVDLC